MGFRDTEILFAMEDIVLLWQYLYMCGEHTVEVKNSIGVPLEISMDGNGCVHQKNLNFPEVPEISVEFSIPVWLGIIDQLKGQPLKDMAGWNVGGRIKNRWDEVRAIANMNVGQNRMKQRQ